MNNETINQIDANTYEIAKTVPERIETERILVSEVRNSIKLLKQQILDDDANIEYYKKQKQDKQAQVAALRAKLTKINVTEEPTT